MKASIVIRTRNEERWISGCMKTVFAQEYKDFEVILVDNQSSDKTVEKVRSFEVRVVSIDDYSPGKALNTGIRSSSGEYIVCLSGHCVPANRQWLENLLRNLEDGKVAGVYGRQRPFPYSSDLDKRDLITVFGLDRRLQKRDSFFHNANSSIRRDLWNLVPFDEEVSNIEDRVWAKEMISRGYHIVYEHEHEHEHEHEPEAEVFHHHGIHQEADLQRCRNVVRIIESLELEPSSHPQLLSPEHQEVVAIIPVRGAVEVLDGRPLVEYTVEQALAAKHVDRVVISTDNPELAAIGERVGAHQTILRPEELSTAFVEIDEVLLYTVGRIESEGIIADIVLLLEITYPFRQVDLIDRVLHHLVDTGVDCVIPARAEYKSIWKVVDEKVQRLDSGFMPRELKDPIHVGLKGLAFATHPKLIREGQSLGERIGILEINDPLCAIEVRDKIGFQLGERLIADWHSENFAVKR